MINPFTELYFHLQVVHSELSQLHTAVHTLRTFIDTNIPLDPSAPGPAPYLCPRIETKSTTAHKRPRDQAIIYAKNQRIRLARSFRSITSSAWKAGDDLRALERCVARFANQTYYQVLTGYCVFCTLEQGLREVLELYRCIKADMAGIPLEPGSGSGVGGGL